MDSVIGYFMELTFCSQANEYGLTAFMSTTNTVDKAINVVSYNYYDKFKYYDNNLINY